MALNKKEINASQTFPPTSQWKINLFQPQIEFNGRKLKCGDVLWLHHSEAQATLAAKKLQPLVNLKNFEPLNFQNFLCKNSELKFQQKKTQF